MKQTLLIDCFKSTYTTLDVKLQQTFTRTPNDIYNDKVEESENTRIAMANNANP